MVAISSFKENYLFVLSLEGAHILMLCGS